MFDTCWFKNATDINIQIFLFYKTSRVQTTPKYDYLENLKI